MPEVSVMTTKDMVKAPFSDAEDSIIQNGQKGKLPFKKAQKQAVYSM